MTAVRADGRAALESRKAVIHADVNPYADGSAEIHFGSTRLLVSAELQEQGAGEVRVEVAMLPLATSVRTTDVSLSLPKEITYIEEVCTKALQSSLDAASVEDLDLVLHVTICVADGGVVASAVAAGWVALYQALRLAANRGILHKDLDLPRVAALSAGIVDGNKRLDLLSQETTKATFHLLICTSVLGGIVFLQTDGSTKEGDSIELAHELSADCSTALEHIFAAQAAAVAD